MEIIVENLQKEVDYFNEHLPKFEKMLKNLKQQYTKLENVKEQQYITITYSLGTAILGSMFGSLITPVLSVPIGLFGHTLMTGCDVSELYKKFDIPEVIKELEDFKIHCQKAKSFYHLLCEHSSNHNDKNIYLLGTALNELEVRFNGYFLHFSKMKMKKTHSQNVLHDLDCNIKEVIAFQQKISNIQEYLNQMKTHQCYRLI